jgi:hypothetical protein
MAGEPPVRTPSLTHDLVCVVPSITVRSSCVAHRIDCDGGPESSVVAFAGVVEARPLGSGPLWPDADAATGSEV